MSRFAWTLLLVIAAECILGTVLVARRLHRPVPPSADWTLLDPITASQIRSAIATCEASEDWRRLGELYMAAGCFAESEACHRVACVLSPDDADYARQWGFALERLGFLEEANQQYRRAIDLGASQPDACRYFIARNHLRAENPQEARRIFDEGRALPANRYELTRLHLRDRDFSRAEELLRSVAADRPGTLQVHLLGYRLALERGDERLARTEADQARYAPTKLLSPFDEEARRILDRTRTLGPNLHWVQARDLINQEQIEDAELLLQRAAQLYRSPAVVELLAECDIRRERFDSALRLFEEFQTENGPSGRILARIGDVHEAMGQPRMAQQDWLHATSLAAGLDLKATHHKLSRSFAATGDRAAADRHLARGHYFVGSDLLRFGYPDKSIAYFEAAVKHDPAFVQAWFYLGEARRRAGLRDPALSAYRSCLKLDADHGRALLGIALLQAEAQK